MILDSVLARAGVQIKQKGYERILDCPFCVERNLPPDTKQHLNINISNGWGHCYRCEWRSRDVVRTAKELARVYGFDLSVRELLQGFRVEGVSKPLINGSGGPTGAVDPFTEVLWEGLPEEYEPIRWPQVEPLEKEAYLYLQSRGINDILIRRFKIGYASVGRFAGRVLFPVYYRKHRAVGTVGRAFQSDVQPKYLNNCGHKLLWGAHRKAKIAIVCEGIFDALAVERALDGVHDSQYAVGLARLGSAVTQLQLDQLKRYRRICIFPDEDRPGISGAAVLAKTCKDQNMDVWIVMPQELTGEDPGSMSVKEIRAKLNQAVKWSESMAWRLRAVAAKG